MPTRRAWIHGYAEVNYEMGGTILYKTVKENDLGVTINANKKVSEQCRNATSKGNQILRMFRTCVRACDSARACLRQRACVCACVRATARVRACDSVRACSRAWCARTCLSMGVCKSFVYFLITSLHLSFGIPIFRCPPTSIFHLLQTLSPHS